MTLTKEQIEKMITILLVEASRHSQEADVTYQPIYTSRMAASFILAGIATALNEVLK